MCAAVCGSKRSYSFEDTPPSSPVTKRHRRSSPTTRLNNLSRLHSLFPHFDPQVLERALEDCGNDVDSAVVNLRDHQPADNIPASLQDASVQDAAVNVQQAEATASVDVANDVNIPALDYVPPSGAEWVDFFVRQLMGATSMDEARARTSFLLERLEKSIKLTTTAEVAQGYNEENAALKQQVQMLLHENGILKRAVNIQHDRQRDYDEKSHELQHLKQLVSQYQEQLRTLEVNNYALTMHLKQAQQGNSMPGRFHPDVF
ncbi:hypothetical protein ACFE04_015090 [Oxalis oulophora]